MATPARLGRVLVTGAAGFIGSHLVDALVDAGAHVIGVDALLDQPYPAAAKRATIADLVAQPRVQFRRIDLRTDRLGPLLEGADAVIHAAALAGLVHTNAHPDRAWSHNVLATRRLVAAAARAGVGRFVHVSTSSVYGGWVHGDEDQPHRPVSAYGRTKAAAEAVVAQAVAEHGLDAVIVRYFSVYGPRQRADMAYHRFVEALLDDGPLTVHGDGHQRRSVTFVTDVVAGTLAALAQGRTGVAYNLGGATPVSVREAISMLANLTGGRPRLRLAPAPPGDQLRTEADTSRARSELGWTPCVNLRDGLAQQVAWQTARRPRAAGSTMTADRAGAGRHS